MLQSIDGKPTRLLFSNDLSAICIFAAFYADDQKDMLRFFIPATKDGIPVMMDNTFYFVCPYFDDSNRREVYDFLFEVKKRSRLAAIVFPHNVLQWTGLITEVGFYDVTEDHAPVSKSTDVTIYSELNHFVGPGDFFLKNHSFNSKRSVELLSLADEYYNTAHERWNAFGKSYVSRYSMRNPGYGLCKCIAKILANAEELDQVVNSSLKLGKQADESQQTQRQAESAPSKPKKATVSKVVSEPEKTVKRRVIAEQDFSSLDQLKSELRRRSSLDPDACFVLATSKLLVAFSPSESERNKLIEWCDSPKVYLDQEHECVVAPVAFYKLFTLLLSGVELKI